MERMIANGSNIIYSFVLFVKIRYDFIGNLEKNGLASGLLYPKQALLTPFS